MLAGAGRLQNAKGIGCVEALVHRNSMHNRKLGPRWNVVKFESGLAKSDASRALVIEESRLIADT